MIYVTQGHQHGIGLEVFIKSFLMLPKKSTKHFCLIVNKENLIQVLSNLNILYQINDNIITFFNKRLQCDFIIEQDNISNTTTALISALEKIKFQKDILITLPSAKKELVYKNSICSGHTDFLRKYFNNNNLVMGFISPIKKILLITEHTPLKNVPNLLNSNEIEIKTSNAINTIQKYYSSLNSVLFSGLNPHAGEGGLLGNEENIINDSIKILKNSFPKINFYGPLSGDTLFQHQSNIKNKLIIYMYHDQGLNPFKITNGILGINITYGLPFIRLSVDHGTAPNLAGKNTANYLGCYYQLTEALKINSFEGISNEN